jgi:hypothetical protein
MRALGIRADPVKVAGGWGETLGLGVHGKLAMWRALQTL